MKRRTVLIEMIKTLVVMALAAPAASIAQRPAHPIRRPLPPGRPDLPLAPGRFHPRVTSGLAGAPTPGVFTVNAVRARDNILQLRDDSGLSADVYVDPDLFDLSTLQTGDQIAVDFFVPEDNDDRLEAASIWKVEPLRP